MSALKSLESTRLRVLRPRVIELEVVESTNEVVRQMIDEGAGEGLVVVARSQSGGRGRLGRVWHSPLGGLYLSIAIRPRPRLEQASLTALMAGIAVVRAVRKVAGVQVGLKWPNDIPVSYTHLTLPTKA